MHYRQSKDQERYRSEEVIVDGKISFWKFGQEVILRGKTEPVAVKQQIRALQLTTRTSKNMSGVSFL